MQNELSELNPLAAKEYVAVTPATTVNCVWLLVDTASGQRKTLLTRTDRGIHFTWNFVQIRKYSRSWFYITIAWSWHQVWKLVLRGINDIFYLRLVSSTLNFSIWNTLTKCYRNYSRNGKIRLCVYVWLNYLIKDMDLYKIYKYKIYKRNELLLFEYTISHLFNKIWTYHKFGVFIVFIFQLFY